MCRLQRGDDAFGPRQMGASLQRFLVRSSEVLGSSRVGEGSVLRADGGIIQPSRNRMCQRNLAVSVLQDVRERALQHAGKAAAEAGGVLAQFRPASAGFNANQLHTLIFE